mmetsp:Transcript_3769/g.8398  ORF Transcript_3769/g.8398 Transcript_3769/m.8398 type:complete len:265 (-) Transcript_3769:1543-2337(-)
MDGIGTVSDQTGKVMGGPCTSSLDDDTSVHAKSLLDETMVHGTHGNEGWNVGGSIQLALIGSHIAKDQHLNTVPHILRGLITNGINRGLHPLGSILQIIPCRDGPLLESTILLFSEGSNTLHLHRVQHGTLQMNQPRSLLANLINTLLLTQSHGHTHDHTLPQRINRRIGHLSESLLEVIVRSMRPLTQHGNGSIIPHGIRSLLRGPRHILDLHTDIFESPSKCPLGKGGGGVVVDAIVGEFHLGHVLAILGDPLSVRMATGNF